MAVSPLIPYALSVAAPSSNEASKLEKAPAVDSPNKQRGALSPRPMTIPDREITEQLNEDVRHKYIKDKKLGEGTYAVVFLGHLRTDPSSFVAIKKIKVNAEYKDGLSMDAIREVKYLQELSHPNIIALHDVFSSKDQNLNLVLEYLPRGDLEMLIRDSNIHYGAADVKSWMGMLARGIWFCHENFILHRDIKPNNLLVAADGEVKLADFGLARSFADPYLNMTHQVITRWYRPPELLFGARQYSGAVDVWSMGMVFAELLLRVPFIAGNSDLDQISKICEAFGTPTEDNWPGVTRGAGDAKSVLTMEARDTEASPSQSRSSSAQGSYSTSATTFEDADEGQGVPKSTSKLKETKGNVIVSVRVRPDANGGEITKTTEWMVDGRQGVISYNGRESGDYSYDNVFPPHEHNAKVYDAAAKRLVRRVMEGYHGTVFAYGMTGTGKTFSMQGTATSPGVIPLAITDIFSFIRETPHREFLLRVSYLEIYNEKIHDLLSASVSGGPTSPQQEEIKLREDSKRGVYATPLKEEIVQSPTQLLRVIARGDHARRTGSTQFNSRSSRSHAVVQIVVESRERVPAGASQDRRSGLVPGGVRVSTLSLIDLAGSERAADDKERRTEGAHINKSLLTLGTIISKLSEARDRASNPTDREGKHLPYRDSKLTRLLQPALSGNSLVSILCTVQLGGTAKSHSGETLNTLKFAARAKNSIVSHAKRAEEAFGSGGGDAGSRVLLERYRMEIQTLRNQLESQTKAQAEKELRLEEQQLEQEAQIRHEEQMLEMQLARTALKERIEHLNRLILCSKSTGVNTQGNLSALGRLSRMSTGSRSLRSSLSQSTLGAYGHSSLRPISFLSVNSNEPSGNQHFSSGHLGHEEEDFIGEFADGKASAQRQIAALQADLNDKNRYISTLERRLLQARRSSHSRMSIGMKTGGGTPDAPDGLALLREKDLEINELRLQLDDKDRMLAALRSAARHRDLAHSAADAFVLDTKDKHGRQEHRPGGDDSPAYDSAVCLSSPINDEDPAEKKRSMDDVSRILDEMIQDRVESGQLIQGSHGSVRVAAESRRTSESIAGLPGLSMSATDLEGSG
ncbi:kinesin family protein [Aspergillus sclerotioniger CBS 115572]|uniref:Kinesin-like protein KIP2 n=1 Tax=Aspergillus sclerotioniger CBS 115572 TaxID=1450535 RepID=A0A317VVZ3_9EURO|nr:kinesin family protein [Aspergillus sclerotioniger CBS 115572]PWY77152.1 kinesin family protein [Aspergillus sclerotioniger CBS 115572]